MALFGLKQKYQQVSDTSAYKILERIHFIYISKNGTIFSMQYHRKMLCSVYCIDYRSWNLCFFIRFLNAIFNCSLAQHKHIRMAFHKIIVCTRFIQPLNTPPFRYFANFFLLNSPKTK